MTPGAYELPDALRHSPVRAVFGPGALAQLGQLAQEQGATRVLLVSDPGIVAAGHTERAVQSMRECGLDVLVFDGVQENPTTAHVEAGVVAARSFEIDLIVGLGGGSSMDCAKGVNFVLSNGGAMSDYWGVGKATKPMLPFIAVPTTAGTGSEAQSFALIADATTHRKMACGDKKALCRVAVLDPQLTRTQPEVVAAASGIDAVSHAVETAATTRRTEASLSMTAEAWTRLDRSFERAMGDANDDAARCDMLLGAHLAGAAIERSMLGAAHACANPLTRRYGITHGVAVGVMLPHVVRHNARDGSNPYATIAASANTLAERLTQMLLAAALPTTLRALNVRADELGELAEEAATQWTAQFNPSSVGVPELLMIYQAAM